MSNSDKTNKSRPITITKIFIDEKNELIKILLRQGYLKIKRLNNQNKEIWQVNDEDRTIIIKAIWDNNSNEWEINDQNNIVIRRQMRDAWEVVGHNTYLYIRRQNNEWHIAGEYGDIFVFNLTQNEQITQAEVDDLMINESITNKIAGIFAVAICIFVSNQKRKYTQI